MPSAAGWSPTPEDALDATRNALIAVARGVGRFDGRSGFTTWLYRVAMNAALDELRRRPSPDPGGNAPRSRDPGRRHRRRRGPGRPRRRARRGPGRLSRGGLRDLCDLDYAEIAAVLDLPIGTVRSRISRGRDALAAILGNSGRDTRRPSEQR